jgi:parallel beta-helix repeat protein
VIQVGDGTNSYSNVTISDLQVDGNKGNNSGYGIYFNKNITYSEIKDNYIHDVDDQGIYLLNSIYNTVKNNTVENSGSGDGGIYLYASSNNLIKGNISSGNSYRGFVAYNSSGLQVIGNTFKNSNRGGAYLSSVTKSIFSSNVFQDNNQSGISALKSDYNTIKGNIFKNNGQSANDTYSDIVLTNYSSSYSNYNIVEGNNITATASNKTKYGIYEVNTGDDYNTITNNTIIGPVSGAIYAQGPHTTVAGNKTSSSTEGIFDIQSQAGATQSTFTVTQNGTGDIVNINDGSNNTILAITDEGQTTFKPSSFDKVFYYQDTPAWTDNTTEAKTSLGTAFTILAATTDYTYVGLDNTFDRWPLLEQEQLWPLNIHRVPALGRLSLLLTIHPIFQRTGR